MCADIFDYQKIEKLIVENKVEAAMSDECDIATPIIAKLSEKFGLETIGNDMAKLFTDKGKMRQFCEDKGFDSPEYCVCESLVEAYQFYNQNPFKLIMKPLDCNSSKGVHTINSLQDIDLFFDDCMRFSRYQKKIILERYISGTEFTVDGIKTPNSHYTLAISKKKHYQHNENIACELLFTHYDEKFDYSLLRTKHDKLIMSTGLPYGFTHAEYRYENGKFFLIEMAARGGGNQISAIIAQHMSGYDTYHYLINGSLGIREDFDFSIKPENMEKCAVLRFFDTPGRGGVVQGVEGIDVLKGDERIKDFAFQFGVGDTILECTSDSARIGYYIACCEDRTELIELMKDIDEKIQIRIS